MQRFLVKNLERANFKPEARPSGALYSALTERSVQNLSCVYQVPWRSIVSLDGWMDGGRRSSKTFHLECVAIANQGALYSALTERSVKSIKDPKFNV
jgi:hypothetical protein